MNSQRGNAMTEQAVNTENELELMRKKAKFRFYILFLLTGICYLMLLCFAVWGEYHDTGYSIPVRIALVIVVPIAFTIPVFIAFFCLFVNRAYDRFNAAFKDHYVLNTIRETGLFENLAYSKNRGFTFEEIGNAFVIDNGIKHYYLSEDLVTGRYYGIRFAFSDVHTRKLVKGSKGMRVETIFHGQVLHFSSFDDIKISYGILQIFQKEFLSNLKGRIAEYKIETENAGFNRKFDIYASDEHNAYYILTPQLIEKIEEFSDQAGAQIALSFLGPSMFVAVNRRLSMFEPNVDKPVAEQTENILNDLKVIQVAGDLLISRFAQIR